MSRKPYSLRGFTLIELLAVLAIVALLTALLFPVFSQSKSRARITQCTSNLRQIGQAVAMYKSDYEDTYPNGIDGLNRPHDSSGELGTPDAFLSSLPAITDQLLVYTKSNVVFRCPADVFPLSPAEPRTVDEAFGSSYRYASLYYGETDVCWSDTSSLYYCYDFNGEWHTSKGTDVWNQWENYLYLDGHTRFGNVLDKSGSPALGKAWGGCQGK